MTLDDFFKQAGSASAGGTVIVRAGMKVEFPSNVDIPGVYVPGNATTATAITLSGSLGYVLGQWEPIKAGRLAVGFTAVPAYFSGSASGTDPENQFVIDVSVHGEAAFPVPIPFSFQIAVSSVPAGYKRDGKTYQYGGNRIVDQSLADQRKALFWVYSNLYGGVDPVCFVTIGPLKTTAEAIIDP